MRKDHPEAELILLGAVLDHLHDDVRRLDGVVDVYDMVQPVVFFLDAQHCGCFEFG